MCYNNSMRKRYILGAIIILSLLGAKNVFAVTYQNNIDISFTFNSALSISLSSADLLIANLAPGASASSNTITVSVDTNNITGYTLSAKVGDGTTYTNDKLVNSSSNTYFDNLTSSSTLANFGNNKWGYALGTISSSTTYSGLVYNTNTTINATTNASGTAATGYTGTSNTSFTIAAKASDTQASGDYQNVIIFTAVSNVVPVTIDILQYMQDFATLSAADKTSVLDSMVEGQGYPLMDRRDNKSYRIAKLADGNVWMLDNLALDIVSVSLAKLKGDTNATDTSLEYLKGVNSRDASNDPNGNYPTSGIDKAWTGYDKDYYSVPMIAVDSATSGPCASNLGCVDDPNSGSWSSDSVTQATINDITSIAQGKVGVYYNYCAASAGSYCYGNGTSSTGSPSSDPDPTTLRDVTEDICPSSWRLPTSGNNGDFANIYAQYSGESPSQVVAFQTMLSTPLSGTFYSGKAFYQGSSGYYWSSTFGGAVGMRYLRAASDGVYPSSGNSSRYTGFSVRCIIYS